MLYVNSKLKILAILTFTSSMYANTLSQTATNGKELYLDANCQKCHKQDSSFDAKKNKAKNLSQLKGWVSSCAGFFNIGWFPDEEKRVLSYLNEIYYKFPTTK